jgi:hypothetical protein
MDLSDIVRRAVDYHNQIAAEAADIGTIIHQRIEEFFKAKVEGAFEKCAAMLTQKVGADIAAPWSAFVDWQAEHRVDPIFMEKVVWHAEEPFYAGRLDLYGEVDGRLVVMDTKSSGAIYHEMLLQAVAYAEALKSCGGPPGNSQESFKLKVEGASILRLDKVTGMPEYLEIPDDEYPLLAAQFLCLCAYWHAKNIQEQLALLPPPTKPKKKEITI